MMFDELAFGERAFCRVSLEEPRGPGHVVT
jgi:hypothetical protein